MFGLFIAAVAISIKVMIFMFFIRIALRALQGAMRSVKKNVKYSKEIIREVRIEG